MTKLQAFADLLEKDQGIGLLRHHPDWSLPLPKVKIVPRRKYTLVDVDRSGKYMVENESGRIFGIKGYGTIHRGHYYGTLDEVKQWDWSEFTAQRKA